MSYTPFDTDETDRTSDVWDKVFGNLQDFGSSFAQGKPGTASTASTPNPFGPVLLIFNPEVFREATDIAICLRSAGGRNFDREDEALSTTTEVNRIFLSDYGAYIKYAPQLQEEFNAPAARSPEVSCIAENEIFSFTHLNDIMIDPYVINDQNLFQNVRQIKIDNGLNGRINIRSYLDGRFQIKQELANLLLQGIISIPQIINDIDCYEDLRDWARRIQRANNIYNYTRYAKYLRIGTILELNGEG